MKNKYTLIIFLVIFIASYYFGQVLRTHKEGSAELKLMKKAHDFCDPSSSTCGVSYLSHQVEIRFNQKPSALQSFTVHVQAGDLHIEDMLVDFRMEDMDMGSNIIRLKNTDNSQWLGQTILPVCSLGRNDWIMQLKIKSKDTWWYTDFFFQQK